jgi:hypothetical protein
VVDALHKRRADPRNNCISLPRSEAQTLLDFIRIYCVKLRPDQRKSKYWQSLDPASLEAQAYLVLKAADWRAAHISMDTYKVGVSDLRSVLFSAMMVARAIQRFSGDDSYDGSYEEIDRLAHENASAVVGATHGDGALLECLDENLDMHLRQMPN